jgi:hypothetical protein
MKELTILMLVLISVFVYINFIKKNLYLDLVESNINKKKYYVRKLPDAGEAADRLAHLTLDLNKLLEHIKHKDRDGIDRLVSKFNSDIITENIPGSSHVAYSVNKGDELSICIREKETEKFIDHNTIIFVSIHELSHIMSKSTGHTPEFWDNMKFLLENAIEIGVYNYVNYSNNPIIYCGQEINSTPLDL